MVKSHCEITSDDKDSNKMAERASVVSEENTENVSRQAQKKKKKKGRGWGGGGRGGAEE